MSQTSGDLTATGSVTLTKTNPSDVAVTAVISGTYGTVTFVFEGTVDNTNWFPLVAGQLADGLLVSGTISPTDDSERAFVVRAENCSQVRLRYTAIASGTFSVNMTSSNAIGPFTLVAATGQTITGTVAVTALTATAGITSTGATGAGIGYATGSGGTVTQGSSITTGVTLNKLNGTITTVSSTLAAGVDASFTLTNSTIAATDVVVCCTKSYGGTSDGIPICKVQSVASGSCIINVHNQGAVTLDAVIVMSFAVVKGVAA